MDSVRHFFLAATTLLVLSACSQPADVQAPALAPQFGSGSGTASADAMSASVDGIYLGGQWNSHPALIKFTRSGRIPWVKTLPRGAKISEVAAGPDGAAYVIYSTAESGGARSFFVRKYSQTSEVLWTQQLATGVKDSSTVSAATDSKSNLYLAVSFGDSYSAQVELRKYWAKGTLAWQRRGDYYIYDLDVSANGFVHTVSGDEEYQVLNRYRPDGRLLWRVPVGYGDDQLRVAVGGEGDIYVATNDEILPVEFFIVLTKYDARGRKLWQRDVQKTEGFGLQGLDADAQGNAFLGLTDVSYFYEQPFLRKELYTYSPTGKRLIYQKFNFGTEEPLVGPVALTPTEVYLATSGVGKNAQSGLLVRLNGLNGSVTWQR